MADALAPWLLDYVLSISETYGANLSNAQSHTKGKKVQITEVTIDIDRIAYLQELEPSGHVVFDI